MPRLLFLIAFFTVGINSLYAQVLADPEAQQLLQLSRYYFNATKIPGAVDSSWMYAQSAASLSAKRNDQQGLGNAYFLLARISFVRKQPAAAREMMNKAIAFLQRAGPSADLALAWFELGGFYALTGNELTERVGFVERSLVIFRQVKNTKKEADVLKELADLHQLQGNFPHALAELRQSLSLRLSIGDTDLRGVYDLLGSVSSALGDFSDAIHYGLLAFQTAEKIRDSSSQMVAICNHLGIAFTQNNDLPSAALYLKMGLAFAKQNSSLGDILLLCVNVVHILIRQGHYADAIRQIKEILAEYPGMDSSSSTRFTADLLLCYTQTGQYRLAGTCYDQLFLTVTERNTSNEDRVSFYKSAICYLLGVHRFGDARKYLDANEKLPGANTSWLQQARNQLLWFKFDSAQGNYLSAVRHYQSYKTFNDSLYNQSKSKQISQLNIQYETDKKDQDLLLKGQRIELLTRDNLLQKSNLLQTRLIRNVTLASILLLLVIVGLLYNSYRQKQRTNQTINRKNHSLQGLVTEKEWLLKEVHHRVKNNLQMIMSLLHAQATYLEDETALLAIRDSQNRVQAMALIHQKLYQTQHISVIDMSRYIRELVAWLRDSFDTGPRIRFELRLDPLDLDVSQAIPLGLILNEAITNAIKYAFPGNRDGLITISLNKEPDSCLLMISDNGIGLSGDTDEPIPGSLGMSLMEGLSEDLGGSFRAESTGGLTIKIKFDPDLSANRFLNSAVSIHQQETIPA